MMKEIEFECWGLVTEGSRKIRILGLVEVG